MKDTIAVIVTYNRLDLLKRCLISIRNQSEPCDIIVVNNGSTDGTDKYLGLQNDLIVINQDNSGGAGGFYTGMKYGYEKGYSFIWLMDDDGMADSLQLEKLKAGMLKHNLYYANALVVNIDNHEKTCFGSNVKKIQENEIIDHMDPFNGTIIRKELISQIGFIKKEMFIWGDEQEYTKRVLRTKFKTGTVTDAIHYHPLFKGIHSSIFPFDSKWNIQIKPKGKDKFFFRNIGYLSREYDGYKKFFLYTIYYLCRFKLSDYIYFIRYYLMGVRNDFSKF